MKFLARQLCRLIIPWLSKQSTRYRTFSSSDAERLEANLEPCAVLLVEGNQRISGAIKWLTQSTWSHAALYVGDAAGQKTQFGESLALIEADFARGVIAVPLSRYAELNVRICRPRNLVESDRKTLIDFMIASIGMEYDTDNVIDLMRYLFPTPPVPVRWRRQMLSLGSGEPTRAICSSLIARAFQSIRYPILPETTIAREALTDGVYTEQLTHHIRHHSLFVPRDFDLSPYFSVIKPTLREDFDYRSLAWSSAGNDRQM